MTDPKMVVVDGIRYRPEDAPKAPRGGADTPPRKARKTTANKARKSSANKAAAPEPDVDESDD